MAGLSCDHGTGSSAEANRAFHMAIAYAGRNPYLSAFYDRLLNQGRRMLHLHFEFLEKGQGGLLLTDEHDEMLDAIRQRDVERADQLAHAHRRLPRQVHRRDAGQWL